MDYGDTNDADSSCLSAIDHSRERFTHTPPVLPTPRPLTIGDSILHPSKMVKNLGVYIDEHLSIDANARHCAKTCFFHLRRIRQLCRYRSYNTLIRALILSRLDRARQLYKNISMLFLFPVKDGKLSTGVNATFDASCYG